ncbi:MAG: polysaccharide pyruvyl transferase family protein [Hyphomicrobiaceae bacterium]
MTMAQTRNRALDPAGRIETMDVVSHREVSTTTRKRACRVGIWGNFGGGNLGNDATLEAALRLLSQRLPDARFSCICYAPEVVTARFGIAASPIFAARSGDDTRVDKLALRLLDHQWAFNATHGLDAIVIPGTGILGDFGERPIGLPYAMYLVAQIARARRIPLAFMSVGAGPITHPVSRYFLVSAARAASYRSYRDQPSRALMEHLGLKAAGDAVYPDLAFALPVPVTAGLRAQTEGRTVGIGVMKYYGHHNDPARGAATYQRYIEKMRALVSRLLARGDTVRLLVGENTDVRPIDDLVDRLGPDGLHNGRLLTECAGSLQELMAQIATTDVVVASRFHNVIAALKMRKPTISLSYSHRHDVLMGDMGVGAWCETIEDFDVETLLRRIDMLEANAEQFIATLDAPLAAYTSALERQADAVVVALRLRA